MSNIILLLISLFLLFPQAGKAQETSPLIKFTQPTRLGLPIDCTVGENCWVMNYVDYGADDDLRTDSACQKRTYDTHKGTDFMILDETAMNKGVPVLSAMDGTVLRVRDGEEDSWKTPEELALIQEQRKECGNAIMIEHANNVQSIYCHLRKNSISVKSGDIVKKGDSIGLVGLSGFTEFPHIHLGIIKNGKIIDPMTGKHTAQTCGLTGQTIWDKDLELNYQPFTIKTSGFSSEIPALENLKKDASSPNNLTNDLDQLTFWTILLGVQENDLITIEVKDPNGHIFAERSISQDKDRSRQFYFIGKNLKDKPPLAEGVYTGTVRVTRENEEAEPISEFKIQSVLITSPGSS